MRAASKVADSTGFDRVGKDAAIGTLQSQLAQAQQMLHSTQQQLHSTQQEILSLE